MNKLIEELAEQAEDFADTKVDSGSEFHPTFCRKFAELIIRECVQQLENEAEHLAYEHQVIRADGILCGIASVKTHFGVK